MEKGHTHRSQPVCIKWDDIMAGQSVNNSYNKTLAKLGWTINNGELSSQLASQQQVKSLKGLANQLTKVGRGGGQWHTCMRAGVKLGTNASVDKGAVCRQECRQ